MGNGNEKMGKDEEEKIRQVDKQDNHLFHHSYKLKKKGFLLKNKKKVKGQNKIAVYDDDMIQTLPGTNSQTKADQACIAHMTVITIQRYLLLICFLNNV